MPLFLVAASNAASGQSPVSPPKQPVQQKKNFNADEFFSKQPKNPGVKKAEWQSQQLETGWRIGAAVGTPLILFAVAAVILSFGAWIYVKLSATTDPAKLAVSDPWIRARLAQGGDEHSDPQPGN
jgi:hypothetical protein